MFCVKPKTLTEGFGLRVLPKTTRSETEPGARSNPSAVRVIVVVVVSRIQRGIGRQHKKNYFTLLYGGSSQSRASCQNHQTERGARSISSLLLEWRGCLATSK